MVFFKYLSKDQLLPWQDDGRPKGSKDQKKRERPRLTEEQRKQRQENFNNKKEKKQKIEAEKQKEARKLKQDWLFYVSRIPDGGHIIISGWHQKGIKMMASGQQHTSRCLVRAVQGA